MNDNLLPLSGLSDEELLRHAYMQTNTLSALELELVLRLERLLDLWGEHGDNS